MGESGGSSGGDQGVTTWNEGAEGGRTGGRKDRREEEGSSEKVQTRASCPFPQSRRKGGEAKTKEGDTDRTLIRRQPVESSMLARGLFKRSTNQAGRLKLLRSGSTFPGRSSLITQRPDVPPERTGAACFEGSGTLEYSFLTRYYLYKMLL